MGAVLALAAVGLTAPPAQAVAPVTITRNASAVQETTAVLRGRVNPKNLPTDAWFEWGTSPSLGSATPEQPVTGAMRQLVIAPLIGLTPGEEYFYRVVATNEDGTTRGAVLSFQTDGDDPPPPPVCTSPDVYQEGQGASYPDRDGSGSYYVHNNNWNDTAGGNSVVTACDYDDWYAVSDIPDHADLSVQTYINVHRDYLDWSTYWGSPLAPIQSSTFGHVAPRCGGCIWNAAYDVWLGDFDDGNAYSHELMIWTENWNQRPAGSVVGTVQIGGQAYQVWRAGSGDGGILTYLSVETQTSGTMPLAAFFADARARGWTPTTTWQVDYGFEIVDTNGSPQTFTVTDFSIND